MLIRNYFIIALRMIRRNPLFSFINIGGLALGLACSLLIFFWIVDELSYDKYHENGKRIYRINTIFTESPDDIWTTSPFPLAPALVESYPFLESYSRKWQFPSMLRYEKIHHFENDGMLVDPGFFKMFSHTVIQGDLSAFLKEKDQIIITESLAHILFGGEDPMGKVIQVGEQYDLVVSGVLADPPKRSEIPFSFLASIDLLPDERLNSYSLDAYSFIMTDAQISMESAENQIRSYYRNIDSTWSATIHLQPYTRIHLNEFGDTGLSRYIRIFGIIAFLILVIACVNYMNLSTARSAERAREIGIRQMIGAGSGAIRRQFYLETALITFFALFLSFILVELLRIPFNNITGKSLSLNYGDPSLWLILFSVFFFTVSVSGMYPAILSSRMNPIEVLKQKGLKTFGNMGFRAILVVFQFTISSVLIIWTIAIKKQMDFIFQTDPGYRKENLVTLRFGPPFTDKFDLIKQQVLNHPNIIRMTGASLLPANVNWQVSADWEGNESGTTIPIYYIMADYDFLETMEMDLVAGRTFSYNYPSDDSIAYIINEAAVRAMELDDPVGTSILFNHPDFPERFRQGTIIGVVKDFHFSTFHQEIKPLVIRIYRPWYGYLIAEIAASDRAGTIRYLDQLIDRLAPGYPFEYQFFEDFYYQLYRSENQMNHLISVFALLAIVISALGIFGLTSFSNDRKTKEIGIRKVNGAQIIQILWFLLRSNMKFVMMALVFAIPVGWYLTHRWLKGFAYKAGLSWWIFVLAGLIIACITLLTIGIQIYKTARRSPAQSLRYE